MTPIEDITRKRSILLTTRLQFSPELQPIKESGIDKVIEQILFASATEKGLIAQEIQDVLSCETGGYAVSARDVEDSLKRLVRTQRIMPDSDGSHKSYRLSEEARRELGDIQRQAEARFGSVVSRLFRNAREGPSTYKTPFLEFLCIIFSRFGEECVRVIRGDIKEDDFLSFRFVSLALEKMERDFDSIDSLLFRNAVVSFFQDSDPDYNAIKWNMAQSYYIAKALGLDASGNLLSKEVFGHAVFYLDTNIIISALEPKHKHHKGFLAFDKACKQLGISLRVCQISLNELRMWLAYQRDLMEKVVDQIPGETAPKVGSIFYKAYHDKKTSGEVVNIDELFSGFGSPMDDLKSLFKVQLEDDSWFDDTLAREETADFAQNLKRNYNAMSRGRRKRKGPALRDATMLLWLKKVREESDDNAWLVTTDTSLPGAVPPGVSSESLAITLDALLQWISPVAVKEDEEDGFTEIFADMIRHRVLPQERILNLEDFLIFHDMHMSCKELPAEDVENCIRYIKVNAPTLDPSNPADREKLAYEVSKYFADPGRKYKQELLRLEAENIAIKKALEGLKTDFLAYKDGKQEESLKRSAWVRISFTAVIFVLLEGSAVLLARQYGEGSTFVQKLSNSWVLLSAGVVLSIVVGWFIVGQRRLKALGWSFTRLFKSE